MADYTYESVTVHLVSQGGEADVGKVHGSILPTKSFTNKCFAELTTKLRCLFVSTEDILIPVRFRWQQIQQLFSSYI